MPQIESIHERVMAYLKARIAEIDPAATTASGRNYWYPFGSITLQGAAFDRVNRVDEPLLDHFTEASERGFDTLALIFSGEDDQAVARSTQSVTKEMNIDIVAARKVTRNTETPFADAEDLDPRAPTVRNRLLQDLKDKLGADLTFGGLVMQVLAPEHENRRYYVDGWDAVHLPITVQYHHPQAAS